MLLWEWNWYKERERDEKCEEENDREKERELKMKTSKVEEREGQANSSNSSFQEKKNLTPVALKRCAWVPRKSYSTISLSLSRFTQHHLLQSRHVHYSWSSVLYARGILRGVNRLSSGRFDCIDACKHRILRCIEVEHRRTWIIKALQMTHPALYVSKQWQCFIDQCHHFSV